MATEPLTEVTLRSMIRDQRYRDDWRPGHRAWVAQVVQGYRDLYGSKSLPGVSTSLLDSADGMVSVRAYERRRNGHVEHVGAYTRSEPEGSGAPGSDGVRLSGHGPGPSGAGEPVAGTMAKDGAMSGDGQQGEHRNLLADPDSASGHWEVSQVASPEPGIIVEGIPSLRLELAGRREACEAQRIRDEAICRSPLVSPLMKRSCWSSVYEREVQCRRGAYIPPLLTGR